MVISTPFESRRRPARLPFAPSPPTLQLVELFPGLVSPDPEERDDMDFLSTIVGHLAEVNMRS